MERRKLRTQRLTEILRDLGIVKDSPEVQTAQNGVLLDENKRLKEEDESLKARLGENKDFKAAFALFDAFSLRGEEATRCLNNATRDVCSKLSSSDATVIIDLYRELYGDKAEPAQATPDTPKDMCNRKT